VVAGEADGRAADVGCARRGRERKLHARRQLAGLACGLYGAVSSHLRAVRGGWVQPHGSWELPYACSTVSVGQHRKESQA